jgi:hypothetical protein
MRRLETTISKQSNHIRISEELEPGITIGNLSGDIITFAELNHIPASAYFTLNEEHRVDYYDVKLYEEL